MKNELHTKLEKIAYKRTNKFCYSCYQRVTGEACAKCGSDDLMLELPGVGVEYGTDWIIQHILQSELEPADLDEMFEESVRQSYPEQTTVGWMTFDTVTLMKEMDPVSWRCALSEFESTESDEGNITSFDGGSTFYGTSDIQGLLDKE